MRAALLGALLSLIVGVGTAHACSCVRAHPANMLSQAQAAIVGVVETRDAGPNGALSYAVRVERALKGTFDERVTVHSGLTSCQVSLQVGARVGLFLHAGALGEWTGSTCGLVDPDALLAAADLPAPRGSARFVAAVQSPATDAIALTASGKPAGYALPQGTMAQARCGGRLVAAGRSGGKLRVFSRGLPGLDAFGAVTIPLRNVLALGCTGQTIWAAGTDGLVKVRGTQVQRVRRIDASAATIAGGRAYFATRGAVKVVTLATNRLRTVRHKGQFGQLSVNDGRVAGYLQTGGAAILSGATNRRAGLLTWLDGRHLLDSTRGLVLDTRLRTVRRGVKGTVLAVEDGAAYVAQGNVVRRLKSGATRATVFARLPGKVVALTVTPPTAAAAWHSCE